MNDTIYALSSGPVPAGVAVIRISGPATGFVIETMAGTCPVPRKATLRKIRDARSGSLLDVALVLWFPAPASFTGEDVAELHCHGGRAVVAAVLEALSGFEGVRPAEAGEFTRRAFDNNRLDLLEVEGLADLISAETEAQRRLAMSQAGGALGALYDSWRARLLRARAMIEADFDFADEDDVPDDVSDRMWADVASLTDEIEEHLDRARGAERLREGLQVVLLGKPNAGKSSLLNALARRDVAIVAEEAGTTRDMIEVHLDLDGVPLTLVDTAGLRETDGAVEREGIRRALERAARADLALWLTAADDAQAGPVPSDAAAARETWRIVSKADLGHDRHSVPREDGKVRHEISVVTGEGLEGLVADLAGFARTMAGGVGDLVATRERQRVHLAETLAALRDARRETRPLELRAEDLRRAGDALGRIAGRMGVEDLLDVIFGEFCIGK
jgi:tRNA modification GTPase